MNIELVIYTFLMLPIFVLGLVGNTLAAVVWFSQLNGVGGARFLLALSISDILAIFCGIVTNILLLSSQYCASIVSDFLFLPFFLSSWCMTIAIVVQRWIAIAFPYSTEVLCSESRQGLAMALLVAVACGVSVGPGIGAAGKFSVCTNETSLDLHEKKEFISGLLYAQTIICCLGISLLLLFHLLLLRSLMKIKTLASSAANASRDAATHKASVVALWVSATTIVSFVFLATKNFHEISLIRQYIKTRQSDDYAVFVHRALTLVVKTSNALTVSVNFAFYSFSSTFRAVLMDKLRCWLGWLGTVTSPETTLSTRV